MDYSPPSYNSPEFNTSLFNQEDVSITIEEADRRYLRLAGGTVSGYTTFNNGITSNKIEVENNISSNITSSSNCDEYGLHLHSVLAGSTGIKSGSSISFNQSENDNVPLANICLDKIGSGDGELVFGTRNGANCLERLRVSDTGVNITGSLSLNGALADLSAITGLILGTFQSNKAMTLNSSGVGKFELGNTTSNCIEFYGGTAFKERVFMFRDSDDEGLTIATKAQTIQKCSPLLHLYSGYDQSGVIGTSSGEFKEVIRSEHKLVGFADNYRSGWFHAYNVAAQAWGGNDGTQFYSSTGALNISSNSTSTSAFASSGNFLILSDGRACLNTTTPVSGYQLTMTGSVTYNGISLTGKNDMVRLQNLNDSTSNNTNILFIGNSVNWQVGCGNSAATAANSFFAYGNGGYRLRVSSAGQMGVNTTSTGAGLTVNSASNTVMGRFIDNSGSNYLDIYCSSGTFGNRIFLGSSTSTGLTFKTNDSPRMTIDVNGWIGVGTESPVYPFQVNNTRGGQEGSQNYFYYLGPGVTNGSTTAVPSNVSIRSYGRVVVNSEIDVISDFRKKENIELLDNDYCMKFVKEIQTKKYNYKDDKNGKMLGYVAQDLMKKEFKEMIMVEKDKKMEEYIDKDGFKSEKGVCYTISKLQIIAVLHNALKQTIDKVDKLEEELMKMKWNK